MRVHRTRCEKTGSEGREVKAQFNREIVLMCVMGGSLGLIRQLNEEGRTRMPIGHVNTLYGMKAIAEGLVFESC